MTTDPGQEGSFLNDEVSAAPSSANDRTKEEDRLEDAFIGERIARERLEGKFLHAKAFGWMKFDGRKWKPVDEAIVGEVVRRDLIDLFQGETQRRASHDRVKQVAAMLSASRIRSILWVCKLLVTVENETFDAHPDLLNVRNGVVNLRDGSLQSHDASLMLTKVALVDYVVGTTHQDWDQALTALSAEAASWLQVRLGQGLTGHPVPDDRLVVLKGSGANGKTTILDGVRGAIGVDYAVAAPDRVLLARNGDHPTELMVLRGARLAFMEEFPELGHLNVKRLKDLHGTGELTARYIAKDTVTWKPTHTMFVTTNYLPRVDESDNGTWRRLALVEFPYRYRSTHEPTETEFDRVGDPNIRERLRLGTDGRHEAVLAWMIAGAVLWYQTNQVMPPLPNCVVEATQSWRKNSDLLLRYIDDRLVFDGGAHVIATELFEDFTNWLKVSGHVAWSDQSFSARIAQHGEVLANQVEKKRGIRAARPGLSRPPPTVATRGVPPKAFTAWVGVRFRNPHEEPEVNDDSDN